MTNERVGHPQHYGGELTGKEEQRMRESGSPNAKQPRSVPTDTPFVWDLVFADMRERDQMGERKHGTRLQPHNGRDALKDAYQEALDLVAYLRQAIYERDQA